MAQTIYSMGASMLTWVQRLHAAAKPAPTIAEPTMDLSALQDRYVFERCALWYNTVYPASDADNWFVSGSAAYWRMLEGFPRDAVGAMKSLTAGMADLTTRLQYVQEREGSVAPAKATRRYDRYIDYVAPRVRGTFLLHQLQLFLGNDVFSRVMNGIHEKYREKPLTTEQFTTTANDLADEDVRSLVAQWVQRSDLPDPSVKALVERGEEGWTVVVNVTQIGDPYRFRTSVAIETTAGVQWRPVEVTGASHSFRYTVKDSAVRLTFNPGNDIPVRQAGLGRGHIQRIKDKVRRSKKR